MSDIGRALHLPDMLLVNAFAAACMLGIPSHSASASDAFPSKVVRIIIPATPGGGGDAVTRPVASKLGAAWGQQVVLDYRPGGGTVLGTAIAAKAPADGYTIVLVQTSFAINAALRKKLPFDSVRDFAPITQIAQQAHLVIVHPSLPVKSIKDLIALAKSKPGQINFGSSYVGSGGHLAGELFKNMTGAAMLYIPYKGSAPALVELLSGQLQVMFATMFSSVPHMKSGRVRAIAVTTAKRTAALPEMPTVAESGVPGYESSSWIGFLAPAGTPPAIVNKFNTDLRKILRSADTRESIARDGGEAVGNSPEEFGALVRSEIDKWTKVIKANGISEE